MHSGSVVLFSQWVEKTIGDPSAPERLPTISHLSRRFGISSSSVRRVLKQHIDEGRLTPMPGRGTFVTARTRQTAQPVIQPAVTSAHSVADAIAEDIAAGKLKHGDPLPAVKVVCNQFKTAHRNVTRAYRILQQKGLVRRVGRNFWVGGMQSIRTFGVRKTIACFNFADSGPSDLTAGASIRHAFTAMEHELHNHHLRISFQDPHKIDLFLRPDTLAKNDYPGIIVSGITEARFTALHPRLVALDPALARSGKRLLFCGTHPQERLPKRIHYFCHGTVITNAVRTAADYCFSRGFQDIVLLFREKLEGISNVRFLVRFISESLMRNPRVRISFLIQPRDDTRSPERLFKQTASYRTSGHFEYLEGLLSKYAPMSMNDLYKLVTMDGSMEKLLEHAPKGAVWLCGDAATARWCISWCRSRRMPVPSAAAILCFDEDPSLAVDGIASCVPDWHTIGYLMAHALIGDIPIKRSRKGFLQTPAVLCERGTMP